MPKIQFFLGKSKGADFEVKRPMIVEESKVQSNYTENDPQAPSYILNRPFYSETVTEPLEITWDGVWGGRPYMAIGENAAFVKLSETVFDLEQLKDSYVTVTFSANESTIGTIPFSELQVETVEVGSVVAYMIVSDGLPVLGILTADVEVEGNAYEKGTYFGVARMYDDSGESDAIYSLYTSALSFPSVTYTKYYKLDNNFVDAEWMATESTGVGTKKFSLVNFSDAIAVGGVVQNFPVIQLDSRPYTEEELKGARLTFYVENTQLAYMVANTETIENVLIATMIGIEGEAYFYLLSAEEDSFVGVPLKKGLCIFANVDADFSSVSNITLEIFNATGQTIPNKLPNKFLDMDWIPKADTYTEVLYEGTFEGDASESIPFDQQLLDLDTTLLLAANGVTIEARAAGTPLLGVTYVFTYTESEYIAVTAFGTSAYLNYNVAEPMTGVSIGIVKKAANPIPRHFLPEGVGYKVVVEIDRPLADGLGGYETTINEAWNSGATVVLQFSDYTLSLLSFFLDLDGINAVAVTDLGRYYQFSETFGSGWVLNLFPVDENAASVLFKAEGSTEFVPTPLNSTLTEGSTLPAQEGAVFTAIQGLETKFNDFQTLVTQANEILEATLNGGA